MTTDAELWADLGTANVWQRTGVEPNQEPLTEEAAAAMIRAAYANGYIDAMQESPPLSILRAFSQAEELWCRIPVI